jgi:hypothetical protein
MEKSLVKSRMGILASVLLACSAIVCHAAAAEPRAQLELGIAAEDKCDDVGIDGAAPTKPCAEAQASVQFMQVDMDEARFMNVADTEEAGRLNLPLVNEPVVGSGADEGNIYECKPNHYHPPCRLIGTRPQLASDEDALAELLAAIRAARSGAETPILSLDGTGPIDACGNSHGMSACCRITARIGDTVYIECG